MASDPPNPLWIDEDLRIVLHAAKYAYKAGIDTLRLSRLVADDSAGRQDFVNCLRNLLTHAQEGRDSLRPVWVEFAKAHQNSERKLPIIAGCSDASATGMATTFAYHVLDCSMIRPEGEIEGGRFVMSPGQPDVALARKQLAEIPLPDIELQEVFALVTAEAQDVAKARHSGARESASPAKVKQGKEHGSLFCNSAGQAFDPQPGNIWTVEDYYRMKKIYEENGVPFNPALERDSPAWTHVSALHQNRERQGDARTFVDVLAGGGVSGDAPKDARAAYNYLVICSDEIGGDREEALLKLRAKVCRHHGLDVFEVADMPLPRFVELLKETEGTNSQGDKPPDDPLAERAQIVLQVLLTQNAVDSDSRVTTAEIVETAGGTDPVPFKPVIADLREREYVRTKEGRGGGVWLTEKGRERAAKL